MAYTDHKKYDFVTNCKLPPPPIYPGKYRRNNKLGTVLTKNDWKIQETKKWFQEMSKQDNYDEVPFSNRSRSLKNWMSKTYRGMSTIEANELLLQVEIENTGEPNERESHDAITEMENDMDDQMDISGDDQNNSPDMFEEFEREDDQTQTNKKSRTELNFEKEETIQQFLCLSDRELVEREDIPKFVQNDIRFIEKTSSFVQNYVDFNFESSQDVLQQMTQIPKYILEHELL